MEFAQLLQLVVDRKASDLHLVVGLPPMLRVDGLLAAVPNEQVLAPEDVDRLIKSFLTAEQIERVTVNKEIDLGVSFSQNARFRANIYHQRGYITAALRRIPMEIPTIEGLKLPQILYTFTKLRQGLVLVTGPTGHGKSTTIAAMLTIAETGHLVFATLHNNSAAQTIDRIVDVFPENQQAQVRLQLSNVLEGVFSQRLVPLLSGGRTAAYEVLTGTNAVRSTIRDGKTHQIDNIIQTSAEFGMTTLEANLATYVQQGLISLEEAVSFSIRPEELIRMVKGS